MKTLFLATAAALSLGVGSAYADGGDLVPNTRFTELPGVIAQAQVPSAPSAVAAAQGGQATQTFVAGSRSQGTWLFPPNQLGGGSN
jgi:hypothetical protein